MEADQVHKIVDKVTSEKDLGVIIDMSLKFTEHINNKANKAYRNVGLIFRTFTYMDTGRFLNLCKSIVEGVDRGVGIPYSLPPPPLTPTCLPQANYSLP